VETAMETAKGGAPNIGAAYEITVFDKDGKVKQVVKADAKCFVMNFLRMVRHWFFSGYGPVTNEFMNLTGSLVASDGIRVKSSYGSFLMNGSIGDLTKGVVVGSDATPVVSDDYKIGSIISHGSGVGQFNYDAMIVGPFTESESTMVFPVSRVISNATDSEIPFSEIALYAQGSIVIMLLRDVIFPSISLQPGESALIVYKIILNG
jgi:hypothetical protein